MLCVCCSFVLHLSPDATLHVQAIVDLKPTRSVFTFISTQTVITLGSIALGETVTKRKNEQVIKNTTTTIDGDYVGLINDCRYDGSIIV